MLLKIFNLIYYVLILIILIIIINKILKKYNIWIIFGKIHIIYGLKNNSYQVI